MHLWHLTDLGLCQAFTGLHLQSQGPDLMMAGPFENGVAPKNGRWQSPSQGCSERLAVALQRCPGSGTLRQDDVKLVTSLVVSTVLSHTNTNPRFHFKMPQACGCIWTAACCTVCPSLLSGFLPPYEQFSSPQIRTCMRSESLQKTMPPARRVSLLATVVAVVD